MDDILSQTLGLGSQALPNASSLYDQISKLNQDQIAAQQQRIGVLGQLLGPYQNYDPVNQAYAAALLRPTRTGSFLESLGSAVEAQGGVLSQLQKEQLDRQDKIASLKNAQLQLALDIPYKMALARRYSSLSPTESRRTLDEDIDLLENKTAEELGISEDQRASMLQEKMRQKLKLDAVKKEPDKKAEQPEEPKKKGLIETVEGFLGMDTGTEAPADQKKAAPADQKKAASEGAPADYPDAKKAPDGHYYIPDPDRPGKYLKVQ